MSYVQEIEQMLKELPEEQIHKVHCFLNRKKIHTNLESILDHDQETVSKLTELIVNSKVPPKEINEFLGILQTTGFVNDIFDTDSSGNLSNCFIRNDNLLFQAIRKKLLNFKPARTTSIGAGEYCFRTLCAFGREGRYGDLNLFDKEIELKASTKKSGVAFRGQRGFGSPKVIYNEFSSFIRDYTDIDARLFSLTYQGLQVFSDFIQQHGMQAGVNALKIIFRGMFYEGTKTEINNLAQKSVCKNGIQADFPQKYLCYNLDYYKRQQNFDGVLIINIDHDLYVYIRNSEELRHYFDNNAIQPQVKFSWNSSESRDGLYRVLLK